jgi:hypothetical protein
MKTCIAKLKSSSPYSQSRAHITPKLNKEGPDDFEERTWREKTHVNSNGNIVIPGMAFKMALDATAKLLGHKIPGRRNATYTKHFLSGVLVNDDVEIDMKKSEVTGERIYVNADGVRGSGKRVWRTFPLIPSWEAEVTFYIADDTISQEVFEEHLRESGKFVGIGRFRPQVGGTKGRFSVVNLAWED